jgi:hypothetical protein
MRSAICLTQVHFHQLAGHFLGLSANDRFLRFGGAMSDAWIVAYVESLFASLLNMQEAIFSLTGAEHVDHSI